MSWKYRSLAAGAFSLTHAQHITLIALANYADDDGYCWPSAATLSRVTRASVRSVKRALAFLKTEGLVLATKQRRFGHVIRRVIWSALEALDHLRADAEGVTPMALTGDTGGTFGVTPMALTSDTGGTLGVTPTTPGSVTGVTEGVPNCVSSPYMNHIIDPYHSPQSPHAHDSQPERTEQGGGLEIGKLISALQTRAISGTQWTPSVGDERVIRELLSKHGESRLLTWIGSMPRLRTHPVGFLVSKIDREQPASVKPAPVEAPTVEAPTAEDTRRAVLVEDLEASVFNSAAEVEEMGGRLTATRNADAWGVALAALRSELLTDDLAMLNLDQDGLVPHLLTTDFRLADTRVLTFALDFGCAAEMAQDLLPELNRVISAVEPVCQRKIEVHSTYHKPKNGGW